MKKLFILLTIISSAASAQNYNAYLKDSVAYREHPVDITHMKVEVSFDTEAGIVHGRVSHSFTVLQKQVDSVFFDAPGIEIKKATLNGQALDFRIESRGVWVKPAARMTWDQKGIIVFEYKATPRKGIYFVGWGITPPATPNPFAVRSQIWTQGQAVDNRYWIPMYDNMNDKFTTETVVTFDKNYEVLSNGKLLKKSGNKDNTQTWHYSMSKPHAGYLLMIAIGKYAVHNTKSKGGVPLSNWYYPEFKDRMEPTYRYTADMMDFLEEQTGVKYPWESYSQVMVQDFLYGAMENTTATVFGDFFNTDQRAFLDRNYVNVNCHEMTHQWFGDYITARDARDTWLQESYATYWPKQFARVNEGEDEWNWQRRQHQASALEAGKKDNYPVRHSQAGSARHYPKGAAVISMLEYVLGEDQWKRSLTSYLKSHAYANVETRDLEQAIQDQTGRNLTWFFDEWVYRGGEPAYKVSYTDAVQATEIIVEQAHATDETVHLFSMPVVLEVFYEDGSSDKKNVIIEKQFETIRIPNTANKKISFVLFDPNSYIIKHVSFSKGFNELKAQAVKAPYLLDRYDAVVAMRSYPADQKRDILLNVLAKEKHYSIIDEIAGQLAGDKNAAVSEAMLRLLADASVRSQVHERIIKSVQSPDQAWISAIDKTMRDSRYSYDVQKAAAEKLFAYYVEKGDRARQEGVLSAISGTAGMYNSIALRYYDLSLDFSRRYEDKAGEVSSLRAIEAFASPQYEFRTRILAFTALKGINHCSENVIRSLFQAMLSTNGRLAAPAAQTAEYFSAQATFRQQMIAYYRSQSWLPWQKEMLKKQMGFLG